MKTMLISSNSEMGFGADIEQHFGADCYSRSCGGYDIDKMEGRLRIAKASLDYDVVVVHAYTNNGGQIAMLEQLVKTWIDKEHAGHIFITGSVASYFESYKPSIKDWRYVHDKAGQDAFCKRLNKKIQEGKYPFKLTNLRLGMLDTKRSRMKEHFVSGVTSDTFCKTIDYVLGLPQDTLVPEIVIETTDK